MAWTIWCFDRLEKLCKDMNMQSFHFDEIYATRRRKHLSFPYAHVPKYIKLININHAISLLQMKGCPQSIINQEIQSFCFKKVTKAIMNFLKTKKPKLKVFF